MSKLIDKFNQASKMPQPMGFRTAPPAPIEPKVLLIASLAPADNTGSLADYITGADAVLLTIAKLRPRAKTLQAITRSVPAIPWGGWLEDAGKQEIKAMVKAGCDFVVFPASTALAIPQEDDEIGKILQVEASLNESLLKAVHGLPVDAVLIADEPGEESSLTWHHLMRFQRFADLLTKPLLVPVPLNLTANELQILWESGVDGVIVKVDAGQPAGRLEELRRIIDKLTFPARQQKKVKALLPQIGEQTSPVSEEEEEEEEEFLAGRL